MSFSRTAAGGIWGSGGQQASVKKAAQASAAKRRKYNASDVTSGGRMKGAAPQRAALNNEFKRYLKTKGVPYSKHITPRTHPQLFEGFISWLKQQVKPNVVPGVRKV